MTNRHKNILIGAALGAFATLVVVLTGVFGANASWLSREAVTAILMQPKTTPAANPESLASNVPATLTVGQSATGTLVSEQTLNDATGQLSFVVPDGWVAELKGQKTLIKPDPTTPQEQAIHLEIQVTDPSMSLRSVLAATLDIPESNITAFKGAILGVRADTSQGSTIGFRLGSKEALLSIGYSAPGSTKDIFGRVAASIDWQ